MGWRSSGIRSEFAWNPDGIRSECAGSRGIDNFAGLAFLDARGDDSRCPPEPARGSKRSPRLPAARMTALRGPFGREERVASPRIAPGVGATPLKLPMNTETPGGRAPQPGAGTTVAK